MSGRHQDHCITLGVRYAFAAPPPPPPSPPHPQVYEPHDYVVYFPWDQYLITPEAQSVLQDAAKYAPDSHAPKGTIVGHTDTSGSTAYNLRLSEHRAEATAYALVAVGLGTVSTSAGGERPAWRRRPRTG
jgi:OOP family OmpA-OmpF porin